MIVYPGSNTVVQRDFPGATSVTVSAVDYNGLAIPITTAAIVQNTNTWRATISIPETAPVCTPETGDYHLIWTWNNGSNTATQDFQVVAYDEGVQQPPPAGLGVLNIALTDEIYLPMGVTNVDCEILSLAGTVVIAAGAGNVSTSSVTTQTPESPGNIKATFNVTGVIPGLNIGEYISHWTYQIGGNPDNEYRQVFIISPRVAGMISSMRMFLDQSQLTRWLSHYQFTDVELIDCLYRGTDRINSAPPQDSCFTPDQMPKGVEFALRQATLHEMLSRLYLAEGLSTFDYQGGSINVQTDRTQFIQTKMDEINGWLDSNLSNIKAKTVTRHSLGVLKVSVSVGGMLNNYRINGYVYNSSQFILTRSFGYGLMQNY